MLFKWKIYFVRHWQTDRNIEWKMNSWDIDSKLNKTWINQAIDAWKKANIEWLKFDIIISSPLIRAVDTAKIIAKETWFKWKIILDERLKEQMAWVLKKYTHIEIKKQFNVKTDEEIRKIFKSKKYNKVEDILEFKKRVTEFYNEILEVYSDKIVLIVWHSWTSRIIFMNSQKLDFEETIFKNPSIPNWIILNIKKSSD